MSASCMACVHAGMHACVQVCMACVHAGMHACVPESSMSTFWCSLVMHVSRAHCASCTCHVHIAHHARVTCTLRIMHVSRAHCASCTCQAQTARPSCNVPNSPRMHGVCMYIHMHLCNVLVICRIFCVYIHVGMYE